MIMMVWQNESVDCVSHTGQGFSKKRKTGRAWQWLIWFQSYLCPRLAPSRIMMQSSNMGERRPYGAPANAAVAEWWPGSRRVPYAQYPPSSTPVPTQREVRPLRPHQRPEHEVRVAAGPDGRRRITAAAAARSRSPPRRSRRPRADRRRRSSKEHLQRTDQPEEQHEGCARIHVGNRPPRAPIRAQRCCTRRRRRGFHGVGSW